MGLNRELRQLNASVLTDKQQRQQERQERKELKELTAEINVFLQEKFKFFLNTDFNFYKNKIFQKDFKEKIFAEVLKTFSNTTNFNIIIENFDKFYLKNATEQIKFYENFNTPYLLNNSDFKIDLKFYIAQAINYYLSLDFQKYKNDLFLFETKENLKNEYIKNKPLYRDIAIIEFDNFYYTILKKQIAIYAANQKAVANNTSPIEVNKKSNLHGLFWLIFTFVNLINFCLAGFSTKKRL